MKDEKRCRSQCNCVKHQRNGTRLRDKPLKTWNLEGAQGLFNVGEAHRHYDLVAHLFQRGSALGPGTVGGVPPAGMVGNSLQLRRLGSVEAVKFHRQFVTRLYNREHLNVLTHQHTPVIRSALLHVNFEERSKMISRSTTMVRSSLPRDLLRM